MQPVGLTKICLFQGRSKKPSTGCFCISLARDAIHMGKEDRLSLFLNQCHDNSTIALPSTEVRTEAPAVFWLTHHHQPSCRSSPGLLQQCVSCPYLCMAGYDPLAHAVAGASCPATARASNRVQALRPSSPCWMPDLGFLPLFLLSHDTM